MSDLVTGEAVPLELRLAKLPSRALAISIDFVVLFVVGLVLFAILGPLINGDDLAASAAVVIVSIVFLVVVIPTTIETLSRGRSVGKLVLGLRVVRDDGGPIRLRHALLRALAGFFADFFVTSGAGAVFCSILNERGKRIGDWLAGTVVLRERVPDTLAPLPGVPRDLAEWAEALELSRLPDDLALSARTFLARAGDLSPRVRDEMGAQLATEVSQVVSPPPPAGVPAWAYLAAVLGERRRRESARLEAGRVSRPGDGSTPAADDGTLHSTGAPAPQLGQTDPGPPSGRDFAPPA